MPDDSDVTFEDHLAMDLMRRVDNTMTEGEVVSAMLQRVIKMTPDASSPELEEIPPEWLEDVALRGDVQKTKDFNKSSALQSKTRAKRVESTARSVRAAFGGKQLKPSCAIAKAASKLRMNTAAGKAKWFNAITAQDDFLRKWSPEPARICTDDRNGRFLLHYGEFDRRSVSWTVRGVPEATLSALKILWGWHTLSTGAECPIPLDNVDIVG